MASDDSTPVASPEKQNSNYQRKKSPSQVELLEKIYADAKYPSDEVRAELSKKTGLSAKQLQVWFTHRRHKDRREGIDFDQLTQPANCNKVDIDCDGLPSTKRGEIDLNSREDNKSEVGYPAAVLAEEQDDDVLMAKEVNGTNVGDSDYEEIEKPKATTKRKSVPSSKEPRKPPYKSSSPKLKLTSKAETVELAAVRAVESQLNGPMREDGPPLGFEFDSPPPGAFEFMSTEGLYGANVRHDNGFKSLNGSAALEGKSGKDSLFLEKKKRKVGDLYSARLPAGHSVYRGHAVLDSYGGCQHHPSLPMYYSKSTAWFG